MNQAFDYNGKVVAQSTPVPKLRTVKKVVHIDSADRDTVKYYTNGDFVVYLPRTYQNVVSLRLKGGEFPPLVPATYGTNTGARQTTYQAIGNNLAATSGYTGSTAGQLSNTYYFMLDIEGLNTADETTVAGTKSTYPNGVFAKIPALATTYGNQTFIEYNDNSGQDNISYYKPALSNLDRLHIRTRIHSQQDSSGFIYWTSNSAVPNGTNQKGAEFSLSLELECLENGFDDFSSFESRISNRS
jgi:hypothetical protein